jgi:hypothetical protein
LESSRAVTGSGDFYYIFLEADDIQRRVRMKIYGPAGSGFVYEKEFLFSGP